MSTLKFWSSPCFESVVDIIAGGQPEDLCGWEVLPSPEGELSWFRTSGAEQSEDKGPQEDHDQSSTEHFLWVSADVSGSGLVTALASPAYTTSKEFCFTFWYYLTVGR